MSFVLTDMDSDRWTNAKAIVRVGKENNVPLKGLVIGIATAIQESGLRNLQSGDRDSLGLFQQRAGWGTAEQRLNPDYAAKAFFVGVSTSVGWNPGLLSYSNWKDLSLTQAAQQVQRSGFPDAYAKHETVADLIVQTIIGESMDTNDILARLDAIEKLVKDLPRSIIEADIVPINATGGKPYDPNNPTWRVASVLDYLVRHLRNVEDKVS